jgi:hypothetical protein
MNPKAGRLIDFANFYPVSLLTNVLNKKIEFKYSTIISVQNKIKNS